MHRKVWVFSISICFVLFSCFLFCCCCFFFHENVTLKGGGGGGKGNVVCNIIRMHKPLQCRPNFEQV